MKKPGPRGLKREKKGRIMSALLLWEPTARERHHGGFTLVELLISIAVMMVMAGMAAQTFRVVLDSRDLALKRLEVSETARASLDQIASDLRSAYITPDSVVPVDQETSGPHFRFAGISRDVVVDSNSEVPGAGEDDDGDGLVDEEILDGIDMDYSGGAEVGLSRPQSGEPDGAIDEDIGVFPSDILHFVSAIENSGNTTLQEVSYGLDSSGTRLVRRIQVLRVDGGSSSEIDLRNFGQFIDDQTNKRLLPPPVPPGPNSTVSSGDVRQAIDNWEHGARYGSLQASSSVYQNNNPGKLFQTLAYDVRGLRIEYGYYDYNQGGWYKAMEWDSARETALMIPTASNVLFNKPAINNSISGGNIFSFNNLIVNEPDDMYPRVPNTNPRARIQQQFLVDGPQKLLNRYPDYGERVSRRTDGLPVFVEITIYVQDRERTNRPRPFTTRIFIPNNNRNF